MEIKKSFRKLAHNYHPDKNPNEKLVSTYFLEIQEAYQVLSNPISKRVYDRERSRLGEGLKGNEIKTGLDWLEEVKIINLQLQKSNNKGINAFVLSSYLEFLLSENNVAIIKKENSSEFIETLFHELLKASYILNYELFLPIERSLKILVENQPELLRLIKNIREKKRKKWILNMVTPWIAVLLTMILCIAMYFYAE